MHRRTVIAGLAAKAALPTTGIGEMFPIANILTGDVRRVTEQLARMDGRNPDDEDFWFSVQQAYAVDRSITNLNNGGVAPAPRSVLDSFFRLTQQANQIPSYEMWRHQEQHIETVRSGLAGLFGCSTEEVAITRNASEALETAQLGIPLERGDEVVVSTQDYPRMLTTWDQRARRDGIVIKKVTFDVPLMNPEQVVRAYEQAITPRTKVLHASQTVFLTGQILPVQELCNLARRHNCISIIDGAHAFAQFPTSRDQIGCDVYGTSLHKWLSGPIGTGMLYVRKPLIERIWPLMAAPPEMDANIRKFEEIGTHSAAMHNALAEAIAFTQAIGLERKAARLRYLHSLWITRMLDNDNVSFNTNVADATQQCALINVHIKGVDHGKLCEWLLHKHNIFTVAITHELFSGLRVTPNVYTTVHEMKRFADAMEEAASGTVEEIRE